MYTIGMENVFACMYKFICKCASNVYKLRQFCFLLKVHHHVRYIYLTYCWNYRESKNQAKNRNHGTKNAIKTDYLNRHKDTHTRGIASISSHTFSSSRLHEKNSTAGVVRRKAKGSEREVNGTEISRQGPCSRETPVNWITAFSLFPSPPDLT